MAGRVGSTGASALTRVSLAAALLLVCSSAQADRPESSSPQTLKLPSGPSSLKGLGESFSPQVATGSGSYRVPLWVPPAVMAPKLALNYSTGFGRSELGVGWSLGLLSIYRTTDKGLPDYDLHDRFAVKGGGFNDELVLVDAVSRTYRLKNEGAFALFRYNVSEDLWRIERKDGGLLVLGSHVEAREQSDRGTSRWLLSEESDRFGHAVTYSYFTDRGHAYLDTIAYQQDGKGVFLSYVRFGYQARSDWFTDRRYGTENTTALRLVSIRAEHGGTVQRHYGLEYAPADSGLLSRLATVTSLGRDGEEMPPLTFGYGSDAVAGVFTRLRWSPPLDGVMPRWSVLEDVNGDGLADLLVGWPREWHYYQNYDGLRFATTKVYLGDSPTFALSESTVTLADMDGDGFRDLVYQRVNSLYYRPGGRIWRGHFTGYGPERALWAAGSSAIPWTSAEAKQVDLNGDGRTDLLFDSPGQLQWVVNAPGNRLEVRYGERPLPTGVSFTDANLQLRDFNGDGHLDLVRQEIDSSRAQLRVWWGYGEGQFGGEALLVLPGVSGGVGQEFHLQDVNRDGQADVVRVSGSEVSVQLNTGQGSFLPAVWLSGAPGVSETKRVLFADMNGNGTTDVVWALRSHKLVYLDLQPAAGAGLLQRIDNGMGAVTTLRYRSSTSHMIADRVQRRLWHYDMPAPMPVLSSMSVTDSLDALGGRFEATVQTTRFEYHDGYYDGREREFRGFAEVASVAEGDADHPTLVTGTWFHVGLNRQSGADEEALKGRAYRQLKRTEDGKLLGSVETAWEHRFLCQEALETTVKVLPDCEAFGNVASLAGHKDYLVAFGVQLSSLTGAWERTPTARYTYQSQTTDSWGNVTRSENWGEVAFPSGRAIGESYQGKWVDVPGDENIQETAYVVSVEPWLLGLASEAKVLDRRGQLLGWSRTYYDGEGGASTAPGTCDEVASFTGLPLGHVRDGLPTRTASCLTREDAVIAASASSAEPSACDAWVTFRSAYNSHGRVAVTVDPEGNCRTLNYDDTGQYAESESLRVTDRTLTAAAAYDRGLGVMTAATGFNQESSRFVYDGLGRLLELYTPLNFADEPANRFVYVYGSPLSAVHSETLVGEFGDGEYVTSRSQVDGLGRERLSITEAEAPIDYLASGWREYSARNEPVRTYDPYAVSSLWPEAPGADTPYSETRYDPLGRPVVEVAPVLEHVCNGRRLPRITAYRPFETIHYDERDRCEQDAAFGEVRRMDGQGRLVEIERKNRAGTSAIRTLQWRYGYNTLGKIVSVTDPKQHERRFWYDSLGRLRYLENPNAGWVRFEHDGLGNPTLREDALGQTTRWVYEAGGRLKSRVSTHPTDAERSVSYEYSYDTSDRYPAGYSLGQPTRIDGPTGHVEWEHDALGQVVREYREVGMESAGVTTLRHERRLEFDAGGKLRKEWLPRGLWVEHDYNRRQLESALSAGKDGRQLMSASWAYDHRGLAISKVQGNGQVECRRYNRRAWLTSSWMVAGADADVCASVGPSSGGATLLSRQYRYHPEGNIAAIEDGASLAPELPRFDAVYTYDRMYQLTAAQMSLSQTQPSVVYGFAYDRVQNLKERTVQLEPDLEPTTETFDYGHSEGAPSSYGPNQLWRLMRNGSAEIAERFYYDAVGQQRYHQGFGLAFNAEGRLQEAREAGGEWLRWWYDDEGTRRLKVREGPEDQRSVTVYPFPSFQVRDGGWVLEVRGTNGSFVGEYANAPVPVPSLAELDNLLEVAAGKPGMSTAEPWGNDDASVDRAIKAYLDEEVTAGERVETTRYFHRDHLGGPSHVTNEVGELTAVTLWTPFGQEANSRGFRPRWGFAGAEREAEGGLGLMQYGARWYSPWLVRWMSPDQLFLVPGEHTLKSPIEAANLYQYAVNNPANLVDPSGLFYTRAGQEFEGPANPAPGAEQFETLGEVWDYNQKHGPAEAPLQEGSLQVDDFFVAGAVGKAAVKLGGAALKKLASKAGKELVEEAAENVAKKGGAELTERLAQRAGHNGVQGPINQVTRTTRQGQKAVRQAFPDGSVKDISPRRVKEFVPNTHPKAPPGAKQKVKFDNAQPGTKGYKRGPTPAELKELE